MSGTYIPHHGVMHPAKPGKVRVVFDCSSSYQGHSLNAQLLQGPDLTNSVVGVLLRFRKEKVAVTCDITAMFHQFRVRPQDRDYLQLFWFQDNSDLICEYRMNVHLFGATSSPSCANFGLKQLAKDHATEFAEASAFATTNHLYVDDGLISLPSSTDAINLIHKTKELCSKANLILHKFVTNDLNVGKELNGNQTLGKNSRNQHRKH